MKRLEKIAPYLAKNAQCDKDLLYMEKKIIFEIPGGFIQIQVDILAVYIESPNPLESRLRLIDGSSRENRSLA